MDTSSFCEYCYCIGGKETCIKPKCLLPVEGCTPIFDPSYCCPIHYNCTSTTRFLTTSTTTELPRYKQGGCTVDGIYHPDGSKVSGIGHTVCDNCYCIKGLVRCEPLSCAPPLLGCAPVIKAGECCAASYNCSGTIEIHPEPFYGKFPVISKDYAKLRKEVNKKQLANTGIKVTVSPNTAHFKQRSPGTTRHFTGIPFDASTVVPSLYHDVARAEVVTRKFHLKKNNTEFHHIENKHMLTDTQKKNLETTTLDYNSIEEYNIKSSDYLDFLHKNIFSLFESPTEDGDSNIAATTTELDSETITTEIPSTTEFVKDISAESTFTTFFEESTEIVTQTSDNSSISHKFPSNMSHPITVKSVVKSTDCIQSMDNAVERHTNDSLNLNTGVQKTASEAEFSSTVNDDSPNTTTDLFIKVDSKLKLNATTTRIIPVSAVLSNKSKPKISDYDYDYNEPSLPPSLPNLRIIPFVAEDALDIEGKKEEMDYPQQRVIDTDASPFKHHNHFSPPVKTEGGFVPKDPLILDEFYENAVTPSSVSDDNKSIANCITHDGEEIIHGQSIASDSPCTTCTCFYGNIACQKPNCPIPIPDCGKFSSQDLALCCPRYICDNDAVATILEPPNGTKSENVITVSERVVIPNYIKDVIRTEPAPNLESLINNTTPFFTKKNTTENSYEQKTQPVLSRNENKTEKPDGEQIQRVNSSYITQTTEVNTSDELSLENVLQLLLFPKKKEETKSPNHSTTKIQTTRLINTTEQSTTSSFTTKKPNTSHISSDDAHNLNRIDSNTETGLVINLAGCNIYGRMYRVGRIILELSGPCVECKCTEIGVHCEDLKC
nr:uncharacterized protein LOC111515240 [Leptinotarsa decemlineata]